MIQKFRTGVFLISGGKDSLLATDMLHKNYKNRIGIMIDVPNCTINSDTYVAYLQKRFKMLIFRVKYLDGGLERFLLQRKDDDVIVPRPNPIIGAKVFVDEIIERLGLKNFDVIGGLNADDVSTNGVKKALANVKRPLIEMSDKEVWEEIAKRDLHVNPTYAMGFTKHSCYPCMCWANEHHITTLKQNVEALKRHFPKRYAYWCNWEKQNNIPFFKLKKGKYLWLHKI